MAISSGPDPRINPYRDDLAALHLRGEVLAAKFVDGVDRQVKVPVTPLLRRPQHDAPVDTELLYGEIFRVYEVRGGYAWGQAAYDDYVGYVPADALASAVLKPGHRVVSLRTFIYPRPDLKARPVVALSMNTKVQVIGTDGKWSEIARGGFAFTQHLLPLDDVADDFVSVAEKFLSIPYLWGGRSSLGLDCSGLIQMALERAGIPAPRDSDMQEVVLGEALGAGDDIQALQRGDMVFWKGHVGVMLDGEQLLHANAHHMAVAIEPLDEALRRIEMAGGGSVTSIRRMATSASAGRQQ